MCSSQTGCSINLPIVLVKKLDTDEIRRYCCVKDKNKSFQLQDVSEVSKTKRCSDTKGKQRLLTTGSGSQILPNDNEAALRSTRKTHYSPGCFSDSTVTSEKTNRKRKKISAVNSPSNSLVTIKKRCCHTNSNTKSNSDECNSKQLLVDSEERMVLDNQLVDQVPTTEFLDDDGHDFEDKVEENNSEGKVLPNKKVAPLRRAYKINSSPSCCSSNKCLSPKKVNFKRRKRTPINTLSNSLVTVGQKSHISSNPKTKSCNNKQLLVDSVERIVSENQLVEQTPIIKSFVAGEKDSEDEDEDMLVLEEKTNNTISKILNRSGIKMEKGINNTEKQHLNRTHLIAHLIDKNKSLSIEVHNPKKSVIKPKVNYGNSGTDEENSTNCDRSTVEKKSTNCDSSTVEEKSTNCDSSTVEEKSTNCDRSTVEENSTNCDSGTVEENSINCGSSTIEERSANCDISPVENRSTNCDTTVEEMSTNFESSTVEKNSTNCGSSTLEENSTNCDNSTVEENSTNCDNNTVEEKSTNLDSSTVGEKSKNCDRIEEGQIGKIKVKSPSSLGIDETRVLSRSTLLNYDSVSGYHSRIEGICTAYPLYFNDNIKYLIGNLIKLLEKMLLHVTHDEKLSSILPTLNVNCDSDSKYLEEKINLYSNEFVFIFKSIINTFSDKDRSKMIPIVYLYIIKAFEGINLISQEGVRNFLIKIFKIENYDSKDDIINSQSDWEKAKTLLDIFERWLLDTKVELKIFKLSNQLMNNKLCSKSENCDICPVETSNEVSNDSLPLRKQFENSPNESSVVKIQECLENENIAHPSANGTQNISVGNDEENCRLVVKHEASISNSYIYDEEDNNDVIQVCVNESCAKNIILPCAYCKELVSCEDLCQVEEDQIFKIIIRKENTSILLSCRLHKNLINSYLYDVVVDSFDNETSLDEEKSKYIISTKTFEKNKEKYVFHVIVGGFEFLPKCLNESCSNKMSLLCYYCKEPVSCHDFCLVCREQTFTILINETFIVILIACKYHQSLIKKTIYDLGLNHYQDVDKPYGHDSPVCWREKCEKKGGLICICKSRCYCSTTCQKEDWYSNHYRECKRQPHPDLLL